MQTLTTLPAHFDGSSVILDVPHNLKLNDKLLVTILTTDIVEEERKELTETSLAQLNRAYGKNEPEYSLSQIKEPNPEYHK